MAQFLLVVDCLMADGSDAAMFVGVEDYKAAMFGLAFTQPVHGYVWCDTHGWVQSDESCVCDTCAQDCMYRDTMDELPYGEFDDGAHWHQHAQALAPLSPGEWASEPCGDPDACGACGTISAEFQCPGCGATLF